MLDPKTMYEEAGRVNRYLLNWRQAAFAGYLIALFAVGNLLLPLAKDGRFFAAGAIAYLAAPLGLALLWIDIRNREIYNCALAAARALEEAALGKEAWSKGGPYSRLIYQDTRGTMNVEEHKHGKHSTTLRAVYIGGSVALLIVGSIFLGSMVQC